MYVTDLISRAKSQTGLGAKYRMGGGNIDPRAESCLDEGHACDCSAFVAWTFRLPKYQAFEMYYLRELNGGWLNTDGMWCDAHRPFGFFERIPAPLPGCIIVYPAHKGVMGLPEQPGPKVGHVGIVTEVGIADLTTPNPQIVKLRGEPMRATLPRKVLHCSAGNFRGWGDAITETGPEVWTKRRSTIYAWVSSAHPPEIPGWLKANNGNGGDI